MASTKPVYLFLRTNSETKRWLNKLRKTQSGKVSQSTMAERIFQAAMKNPKFIKAA